MLDAAAEVDPPELGSAGHVTERAERDPDLHGVPVVEKVALHPPDRVPVGVRVPFVGHLRVEQGAQRVRVEQEAVPPVVEGVDDDREAVAPVDVPLVAAHLVGHQTLRVAFFEFGGDVEAVRVVEHPDAGALRGGRTFVGLLLDKPLGCGHLVVHRVVEDPVHGERLGEPEGAEGYPAVGVPADGFARRGSGWPENAAFHRRVKRLLAVGEPAGTTGRQPEVVLIILNPAVRGWSSRAVLGGGRAAGAQERADQQQNGRLDGPPEHLVDQRMTVHDLQRPGLQNGR